jgi:hypothetical protein
MNIRFPEVAIFHQSFPLGIRGIVSLELHRAANTPFRAVR